MSLSEHVDVCATPWVGTPLCDGVVLLRAFATELVVWIELFGLPALMFVFFLKGTFILKPIPASILLPGYLLAVGATFPQAVVVASLSSASSVAGQFVVYQSVSRGGLDRGWMAVLNGLPFVTISTSHVDRATEWFHRYGALAIFGFSVVPGLRGTMMIPAALTSYPPSRAVLISYSGTFTYHSLLAVAAVGVLQLF